MQFHIDQLMAIQSGQEHLSMHQRSLSSHHTLLLAGLSRK